MRTETAENLQPTVEALRASMSKAVRLLAELRDMHPAQLRKTLESHVIFEALGDVALTADEMSEALHLARRRLPNPLVTA